MKHREAAEFISAFREKLSGASSLSSGSHPRLRYQLLRWSSFFPGKKSRAIFASCLAPPPSTGQHGCERRVYGYHSEGVDQAAGSPTCKFSGAGRLPYSHPLCRHLPLHDRDLLHPLLLLRKAQIPGFKSSASAAGLKMRQRPCSDSKYNSPASLQSVE